MFGRIEKMVIGDCFDIEKCFSKKYPKGFFVITDKRNEDNVMTIETEEELKSLYKSFKFLFEIILK